MDNFDHVTFIESLDTNFATTEDISDIAYSFVWVKEAFSLEPIIESLAPIF